MNQFSNPGEVLAADLTLVSALDASLYASNALMVRAMKTHTLVFKLVIGCASALIIQAPSYAQRTLNAAQLDSLVRLDMNSCSNQSTQLASGKTDPAAIIPASNAQSVTAERITKTLHGIWRGRVLGDDKDIGVDYFWITDTKRNESLVIAQRSGTETVNGPVQGASPPKFSFLMCAHDGYTPSKATPQIHEFVKVSDNIDEAPRIVQRATGLKLRKANPTLSDLWQGLVAMGYFNDERYSAYAGGFFKSFSVKSVANPVGASGISMNWNGEYRGGGSTALKFINGVPVYGVEHAEFTGTRAPGVTPVASVSSKASVAAEAATVSSGGAGDFLVSSPGNGKLWKVEAFSSAAAAAAPTAAKASTALASAQAQAVPIETSYELAFDKVVLGPLQ